MRAQDSSRPNCLRVGLLISIVAILSVSILQTFWPRGHAKVGMGVWGVVTAVFGFVTLRNNSIDFTLLFSFGLLCFFQGVTVLIHLLQSLEAGGGFDKAEWLLLVALVSDAVSAGLVWYAHSISFGAASGAAGYQSIPAASQSARVYGAVDAGSSRSPAFTPFVGSSRKLSQ